jgi:cytochrome c oxidase subunit 1
MLFAVGFIALFIIGGLSGVMHSSPPADLQQTDTYFVVAHFHYVLFGGSLMGLFAGIYFWWPKMFGRLLNEPLGKTHFWLMFLGMNLTFFPMHFVGLLGMPRRIYTYDAALGLEQLNMVETVGAFVTALAVLVFMVNVLYSRVRGTPAGKNPWNAAKLEWAVSSPPPPYNFSVIPQVRSRVPLWVKDGVSEIPDEPPGPVHVPGGSWKPLVVAVGILLLGVAAVARSVPVAVGAALVIAVGIYLWAFEPFEV